MYKWWDIDGRDHAARAIDRISPGWWWPQRSGASFVGGVCIHHSAGSTDDKPLDVIVHAARRGMSLAGVPFGYHVVVGQDGLIFYAVDIDRVVYHNGGTVSPAWRQRESRWSEANGTTVGVCIVGNFTGGRTPTGAQLDAARWVAEQVGGDVTGHKDWKATQCPGDGWGPDGLGDEPLPLPSGGTEDAIRAAAWSEVGIEYNPNSDLVLWAARHDLGRPVTPEFDVPGFRGQGYDGGIVYTRKQRGGEVDVIDWLAEVGW